MYVLVGKFRLLQKENDITLLLFTTLVHFYYARVYGFLKAAYDS